MFYNLEPHALQKRASGSLAVPHAQRRSARAVGDGRALGHGLADPLRDFALDLLAVAAARIELAHQPHGAPPEAAAHLVEVGLGHLAHREVELEFLDRAQHEGFSRSSAMRVRPPISAGPSIGSGVTSGASIR